eukprot:scaffold34651_cov146-Amphora_coffeaeformis.AAC.2
MMTSKTFRGVSLHNNEKGNSRGMEGKKGLTRVIQPKLHQPKTHVGFDLISFRTSVGIKYKKVLGAPFTEGTCAITPEISEAGPSGLLGWLEEQKNDTSYCVWQYHESGS